ncbi:MAG: hypothetical protein AABY45_10000 [Deltaproteobacteria bacterium]|jgi:hypothetical protein
MRSCKAGLSVKERRTTAKLLKKKNHLIPKGGQASPATKVVRLPHHEMVLTPL